MGIYKLMDLLQNNAPDSIRMRDLQYYSGISVAMDATMFMNQFLVSTHGISSDSNFLTSLTDKDGNKTEHLLGLFNRTILMMEHGLKPAWIFEGSPPKRKNGQILRRKIIKQELIENKDEAVDLGSLVKVLKQQQRTAHISHKEKDDAMTMLRLMGVPVIQAPGSAQAQCSYLNRMNKVDAVCTQDTDSILFGTELLIESVNNRKEPVCEVNREKALGGLELTEDQFIDMCILSGCDYASKIEGIGPLEAYSFVREHKNLENIIEFCISENLKEEKYKFPNKDDFDYEQVRRLFKEPNVLKEVELKWEEKIDEEALKAFLVGEKGFSKLRVESGIQKIQGFYQIGMKLPNSLKPVHTTKKVQESDV